MELTLYEILILIFIVVFLFPSRFIAFNAIKMLNQDQRMEFLEYNKKNSAKNLGFTLGLLILYFLGAKQFPEHTYLIMIGLGAVFVLRSLYRSGKIKQMFAPKGYPSKFFQLLRISTFIPIVGFILIVIALIKLQA